MHVHVSGPRRNKHGSRSSGPKSGDQADQEVGIEAFKVRPWQGAALSAAGRGPRTSYPGASTRMHRTESLSPCLVANRGDRRCATFRRKVSREEMEKKGRLRSLAPHSLIVSHSLSNLYTHTSTLYNHV